MPIFQLKQKSLLPIKEKKLDLEKDLQKVTENNLEQVFNLKFISTEFSLHNLRLDTLAFDQETKSFVIIEYKKDRSFSVVDQGFAYLALMLNNKADFILEYNEKMNDNLKREDIDWSQSRVLFLANSFTTHQRNAINFRDLAIELWEVKKYQNALISFSQLKPAEAKESIKKITKDKTIATVSREVKKYSVADHFKADWIETKKLYEILNDRILNLDSRIEEVPTKVYIGYKIGKDVLFDINIRKSNIDLHLNRFRKKDLKDPENKVEDIKNSMKHWNKHVSRFYIREESDIDYAMFLIKQLYEKFK